MVDESLLALKSESLTFLEAASIPLVGIGEGNKVLIHGGAGGVGGYAIELAKAVGCHVITTTRGVNREYVRARGADEVVDCQIRDFWTEVHDCDVVLSYIATKLEFWVCGNVSAYVC